MEPAAAHGHQHSHDHNSLAHHLREIEVKHETFHLHDPEKELATLSAFRHSLAFTRCVSFLLDLCAAVQGHAISSLPPASGTVARLCEVLQRIDAVVNTVEPVTTVTRFGNPAFKTLIAQLRHARPDLERCIVGDAMPLPPSELFDYLLASLGDAVRVDYGTGHELSFLAFLAGLGHLRIVGAADMAAVGLTLLSRYFALVRKLQKKYRLEPAGSRGCWGLDDYQFLPFLVGAAQLATHPRLRPKSVLDADIREAFAHDFMYLAAIAHVRALSFVSYAVEAYARNRAGARTEDCIVCRTLADAQRHYER